MLGKRTKLIGADFLPDKIRGGVVAHFDPAAALPPCIVAFATWTFLRGKIKIISIIARRVTTFKTCSFSDAMRTLGPTRESNETNDFPASLELSGAD